MALDAMVVEHPRDLLGVGNLAGRRFVIHFADETADGRHGRSANRFAGQETIERGNEILFRNAGAREPDAVLIVDRATVSNRSLIVEHKHFWRASWRRSDRPLCCRDLSRPETRFCSCGRTARSSRGHLAGWRRSPRIARLWVHNAEPAPPAAGRKVSPSDTRPPETRRRRLSCRANRPVRASCRGNLAIRNRRCDCQPASVPPPHARCRREIPAPGKLQPPNHARSMGNWHACRLSVEKVDSRSQAATLLLRASGCQERFDLALYPFGRPHNKCSARGVEKHRGFFRSGSPELRRHRGGNLGNHRLPRRRIGHQIAGRVELHFHVLGDILNRRYDNGSFVDHPPRQIDRREQVIE